VSELQLENMLVKELGDHMVPNPAAASLSPPTVSDEMAPARHRLETVRDAQVCVSPSCRRMRNPLWRWYLLGLPVMTQLRLVAGRCPRPCKRKLRHLDQKVPRPWGSNPPLLLRVIFIGSSDEETNGEGARADCRENRCEQPTRPSLAHLRKAQGRLRLF